MESMIAESIRERRSVVFVYDGSRRTAEPHIIGYSSSGKLMLSAFQTSGGSGVHFRSFDVMQISNLSISTPFEGPRRGYNRGDKTFLRVIAQL